MRKKQLTAILLSAILALSACMPVSGISALAAEDTGSQATSEETVAVPETGFDETAAEEETVSEDSDSGAIQVEIPAENEESLEGSYSEPVEEAAEAPVEEEQDQDAYDTRASDLDSAQQEDPAAEEEYTVPVQETDDIQSEPSQVNDTAGAEQQEMTDVPAEEQGTEVSVDSAVAPEDNFDSAEEIRVGDTFDVTLTSEAPYIFFKYVPEKDMVATFSSTSEIDTFVDLFDGEHIFLTSDDDKGEGNNFSLTYSFVAGNTYFFRAKTYSTGEGSFSVSLEEQPFFVDHTNEGSRYADPGEAVTLQVVAASDTELSYTWFINDDAVQEGDSAKYTYIADGPMAIRCEVRDQSGNSDTVYYNVLVNSHWSAGSNGGFKYIVEKGQSQILHADVSVEEGYEDSYTFTYTWHDGDGNELQSAGNSYTVSEVNESMKISCTVSDQYGNQDSISFLLCNPGWLDVYPSGAYPGASSVNINVDAGSNVELAVNDNTSGESPVHYTWYDENNETLEGSEDSSYYEISDIRTSCTVRCHAEDEAGNSTDLYFNIKAESYLTAYPEGGDKWSTSADVDITEKDSVILHTIASNSAGLGISYQWKTKSYDYDKGDWQEEWTAISGATKDSYTVNRPRYIDQYCCDVTDEDGHNIQIIFNLETSVRVVAYTDEYSWNTTTVIDVRDLDEILLEPYFESGDPATMTYQWAQLKGEEEQILQNEKSSSYKITAPENGNTYTCTIQDRYGGQVKLYYIFRLNNNLQVYTSRDEWAAELTIDPRSKDTFTLTPYVLADDKSQLKYSWSIYTPESEESAVGTGTTLFIDHQPEHNTNYHLNVSDQYGNSADVYYYFQVDTHLTAYPEGTEAGVSEANCVIGGKDSVMLTAIVEAEAGTKYSWKWYKNYEPVGESNSSNMDTTGSVSVSIEAVSPADGDTYYACVEDDYGRSAYVYFYLKNDPPALSVYPEGADIGETRAIIPYYSLHDEFLLRVGFANEFEKFGVTYDWRDPEGNSLTNTEEEGRSVRVGRPVNGAVYTCTVTDSYDQKVTLEYEFQYQRQEGDPTEEDMKNAKSISVGDSVHVSVTDEDPVAWFKFTPKTDGKYELYSEADDYVDAYATLYDEAGVPIISDDEGSGSGHFAILESFRSGETSYFGVREYFRNAADFTIHLVSGERSDWLSDYDYRFENDQIELYQYKGEETDVTVPGSASVRGKEYKKVLLSNGMWNDTEITSLSFEKGVIFPESSSSFFSNMKKLVSVDMSEADLSGVVSIDEMFVGCTSLSSLDMGGTDLSQVKSCSDLFTGCNKLEKIEAPLGLHVETALPRTYVDSEGAQYTSLPMDLQTSITLTKLEESEWLADYSYEISDDVLTLLFYTGKEENILVPGSAKVGDKEFGTIRLTGGLWNDSPARSLKLEEGVVLPEDCSSMFYIPSLETIDLSAVDMANVTVAADLFGRGTNLQQINSPKNTTVTAALPVAFSDEAGNVYSALPQGQAESLKLIRVAVSDWLADYNYEIKGDRIRLTSYQGPSEREELTIPGNAVVGGKEYKTIELGNGIWKENGHSITALHFGEGVVLPEDCSGLFEDMHAVRSIDLGVLDWSNVTNMDRLFADCWNLTGIDLQLIDTGKVTSMSEMFRDCDSLKSIDLSSLNTSNVTDMSFMFSGCEVETLDLSGLNTGKVTDMSGLFSSCWNLKDLNISGLNTENVTDMNSMFYNCDKLETIDLTVLKTGNVTDMSEMFSNCSNVKNLNLSGLDLSSVKDMSRMFEYCGSITELDLSGHDMSSAETMKEMFRGCWELTMLNLNGCNASGATTMYRMFSNCYSLTDLKMNNFKVDAVTNMSYMFYNCYNLATLDLSSLKPAKVTNIRSMFRYCDSLAKLDLSGIDASGVEHAGSMFDGATKLERIETPTNLSLIIYLPVVYQDTKGALYGTLPRGKADSLTLLYARPLAPGESGDPVPATGITLAKTEVTYTGSAQKPAVTVKWGDTVLKAGTDYTVAYSNNTNAGTATVTVTGTGTFTGTNKKTFKIKPAAIAASGVTVATSGLTYNGKAKKPAVTVKVGGKTLKSGTDYTLAYKNNINAGNATATVTGKGNYSGTVNKTFKITKAAQAITAKAAAAAVSVGKTTTVSVTGAKGTKTYKSSNTGIATVTSAGKVTAKKVGTVKITVTCKANANYNAASRTVTIKVVPAATTKLTGTNLAKGIKLTWARVAGANGYIVYRNNKAIKTIAKGTIVTYTDAAANTNGAKYVYKIVAKASTGNSKLSRSLTFYRVARPAISSVKNSASKKATVKWGKNAKATGYQIQYGLKSNFSGAKTVTIGKAATVSRVISSLTKNKTYYFRIRTYKKVGKVNYYSAWSASKSLKIKK